MFNNRWLKKILVIVSIFTIFSISLYSQSFPEDSIDILFHDVATIKLQISRRSKFAVDEKENKIIFIANDSNKLKVFDYEGSYIENIDMPKGFYANKIILNSSNSIVLSDVSEENIFVYNNLKEKKLNKYSYKKPEDWYSTVSEKYEKYFKTNIFCPAYYSFPISEGKITRFEYFINLYEQNNTIYSVYQNAIMKLYIITDTAHKYSSWRNIIPCNIDPLKHLFYISNESILYASDVHWDSGPDGFRLFYEDRRKLDVNKSIFFEKWADYYITDKYIYLLKQSSNGDLIYVKRINKRDLAERLKKLHLK